MNSSTSFVFNWHLWGVFKASQTALKGQKWPKNHRFWSGPHNFGPRTLKSRSLVRH